MFNWFKRNSNISEPVTTIVELLKKDSSRFEVDINQKSMAHVATIIDLNLKESFEIYETVFWGAIFDRVTYRIKNGIFNGDECQLLFETASDLAEARKLKLKCLEKTRREAYSEIERKRLIGLYCK